VLDRSEYRVIFNQNQAKTMPSGLNQTKTYDTLDPNCGKDPA
jgi:hypothetical protein